MSVTLALGHQIVGIVEKVGTNVGTVSVGEQIGVPWLGGCCGKCEYCVEGKENLCDHAMLQFHLLTK